MVRIDDDPTHGVETASGQGAADLQSSDADPETVAAQGPAQVEATCGVVDVNTRRRKGTGS